MLKVGIPRRRRSLTAESGPGSFVSVPKPAFILLHETLRLCVCRVCSGGCSVAALRVWSAGQTEKASSLSLSVVAVC